jgi:sugar phosphate isomerase/epimerase
MSAHDAPLAPQFRLGVTLHSFTHQYCSFQWSFEDMLEIASLLGGGVEIVGPAHHRCFPDVSDEFERRFKSAVARYGLTPTCYGTYADPFMRPDRDLTPAELTDYTLRQLAGAVKLGFPVARLQYYAAPIVERVLPFAERHGLKLGYELHAPLTIESATTQGLLDQVRRISSPCLGLIPDAGIFCRSIPQYLRETVVRRGVSPTHLQLALKLWQQRMPLADARAELLAQGVSERHFVILERFWGSHGQSEPGALLGVMPHVVHFHGKFFSMSGGDQPDEPDVRYADVVKALVQGGYRGWISSEYEGPPGNSFDMVRDQQRMFRRYMAAASV